MIYLQVEEQIYKAKTYKQLVKKLYECSFDQAINKANFMFDVQERIKQLYDRHISVENYEQFILDLDELGLVKIFRCKECKNYALRGETPYCIKGHKPDAQMIECEDMDFKGKDRC